jgi:2Fe-2S ferredoxin
MPRIFFIARNGEEHPVECIKGDSVMQVALDNTIPGIEGECGGSCMCASCHAYIDHSWIARTGRPSENENAMLEGATNVRSNSRLMCQIEVSDALDGLIVRQAGPWS